MDGFELYIKIREKDPKVKICFFTATAMFIEEIKKHYWHSVKQSLKTTLFKNQSELKF
jgi:hypothetical protein